MVGGNLAGANPMPGSIPRQPQAVPPPAGGNAVQAKKAGEGPAKGKVEPLGALVPTMVGPGGAVVPPTGTRGAGPAATGGR
jgi:hypothetical protein